MRAIRQYDSFRCGPVAVVNAMKWLGKTATYETMLRLSKKMKSITVTGTERPAMKKQMHKLGNVVLIYKPCISRIDSELDAGKLVILNFRWVNGKKEGLHYAVLYKRTPKFYYGWNIFRNQTSGKVRRKVMTREFLKQVKRKTRIYPIAWFLE